VLLVALLSLVEVTVGRGVYAGVGGCGKDGSKREKQGNCGRKREQKKRRVIDSVLFTLST
jgi:hypothetical protein